MLTKTQRSLRARVAAHSLHAQRDSNELTEAARAAFLKKFEDQADPEGVLHTAERRRRAEHLRRAHFARLAFRSSRKRSPRDSGDVSESNRDKNVTEDGLQDRIQRRREPAKNALRAEVRFVFKQLRRERNLTQAQLAARTGGAICADSVSDLETGQHASNPATVDAVLKVLRVSMDQVLDRAIRVPRQSPAGAELSA